MAHHQGQLPLAQHKGGIPIQDLLFQFAERWSLEQAATDFLCSLDEVVLRTILTEFRPNGETRDVTAKLKGFAKSVTNRLATDAQAHLEIFAANYNLDSAGVAWLHSLPLGVSTLLVRDFRPNQETRDVIAKMKGFAKSIMQRQASDGLTSGPGRPVPHLPVQHVPVRHMPVQHVPIQRAHTPIQHAPVAQRSMSRGTPIMERKLNQFAGKWGLADDAIQLIWELQPDVQAIILTDFQPKGDTRNMTDKLRGFVRSVMSRYQNDAVAQNSLLEQFVAYWGVDQPTIAYLQSLPEDVVAKVVSEFAPRADTKDINGRLRTFANGILNSAPRAGTAPPLQTPRIHSFGAVSQHRPVHRPVPRIAAQEPVFYQSAESWNPAVHEFALQWGLDDSTIAMLESFPPEVCEVVFAEFQPRGDTKDIGGKLRAFATNVSQRLAKGKGKGVKVASAPARASAMASNDAAVAEFAEYYQLNEPAQALLYSLTPDVQLAVITEFQPREDTKDMSGKFIGFANGVAAKRAGGQKRPLGGGAGPAWKQQRR